MQDDVDTKDEEVAGLQDLVEQTREQAALTHDHLEQTAGAAREVPRRGTTARERAAYAKQRELAAHQRAIELHERAAELQERLGHPDRAAAARQHADHARELLELGRFEQLEAER
jgi:hypothetical protein